MFNPQMTSSQMELLPLVCLCLLSWSGTTSAQHVVVEEDSDAILKCSIDGSNIETAAFEWTKDGQTEVFSFDSGHHHNNGRDGQAEQFRGRVSHFQDKLKHGNASIKITNTTMDDSGNYTCKFPNIHPSPTFCVKLVVGAAPKPSVKILDETETSALLQCEAHGVPELEVHWQDSDGNIIPAEKPQVSERGGLSYITLNTTVTKKGRFYCVATQMNISHTVSNEIYVRLPKRVVVKQDDDVILPCSIGSNIESGVFDWKKDGQTEVFLYNNRSHYNNGWTGQDEQFKGRVSHFQDELKHGNASIKITKMTMDDGGDYTCIFPNLHPSPTFHVKLVVGAALEPSVTILNTQDGVLLQCVVRRATPKPKVEWKDSSGNIVPAEEPQVTETGGSYDIILRAPVTKTDNFHCVVTQEEINHQISAEMYAQTSEPVLKERTGENIPGAAPKPFVTILDETETSALLQCKAHGVPDLEVHWQDSAGNKLTAEKSQVTERGLSYITLNTTVTKTDRFSCVATQKIINHTVSAEIYVSLPVVVEEGIDVILPCSIGFSFESGMFDWKKDGQTEVFLYNNHSHYNNGRTGQDEQFKGRVSHFEDELNTEHGNASIKIKRTKVEDSGDYTCVFPNLQPPQRFNVKLVVGAVSEPSVTILHQTKTSALLQCKAHGVPEPELKWQDSAGNILPAEKSQVTKRGLSYITLKTTVTKTDNFSCVATQMKLGHRIPTGIHVYIHEDKPQISHSAFIGLVVAAVLGPLLVVLGVVLLVVLIAKGRIVLNLRKDEKQPEEKPKNQQNSEKQPDQEV